MSRTECVAPIEGRSPANRRRYPSLQGIADVEQAAVCAVFDLLPARARMSHLRRRLC